MDRAKLAIEKECDITRTTGRSMTKGGICIGQCVTGIEHLFLALSNAINFIYTHVLTLFMTKLNVSRDFNQYLTFRSSL